jgi:hypothetical protein
MLRIWGPWIYLQISLASVSVACVHATRNQRMFRNTIIIIVFLKVYLVWEYISYFGAKSGLER